MLAIANILRTIFSIGIIAWLFIATFFNAPSAELEPTKERGDKTSVSTTEERKESITLEEDTAELNKSKTTDETSSESSSARVTDQEEKPSTNMETDEELLQLPSLPLPEGEEFGQANSQARASVVNIVCEMRSNRTIKTITGSGVIIDARGVILTNAHLAQFLLLKDYPEKGATRCLVRMGNPAQTKYEAELLYIPITWVQENAHTIIEENPSGTGEGDYALIYITKSVIEDEPLPRSFPHLPVNTSEEVIALGEPALVASYPALVANTEAIKNNLYLVSTVTETGTLYTFSDDYLDLFALKGTVTAQRGSSGGAVVNQRGELIGIVVTSTNDVLVLNRELRVLTPAYINRSLAKENGTSLAQILFGDLSVRAQAFKLTTAPLLGNLLIQTLNSVKTGT